MSWNKMVTKKRGTVYLDMKDCPKCGKLMSRQIKKDLSGKEYVCDSCGHTED